MENPSNGSEGARLFELSNLLWRERRLLELVVFKLEQERLLAAADDDRRSRWEAEAARETAAVADRLAEVELERVAAVEDLAADLDLPSTLALRELSGRVPQPWAGIFDSHRRALLELTREVGVLVRVTRHLVETRHRAVTAALRAVDEMPEPAGATFPLRPESIDLLEEVG